MDHISAWWKNVPGERYWLDVTGRHGRDQLLAAPRGEGKESTSWIHRVITHVRKGDVVFHYDASREAIVAWSVSDGRVEKKQLFWPLRAGPGGAITSQKLHSWGIRLRQTTMLDDPVRLQEIARMQWSLFPALRALEDKAGHPLHYPFEMGNRAATRLLAGYVFKLPAVFVMGFPELASAAGHDVRLPAELRTVPSRRTAAAPHPQTA